MDENVYLFVYYVTTSQGKRFFHMLLFLVHHVLYTCGLWSKNIVYEKQRSVSARKKTAYLTGACHEREQNRIWKFSLQRKTFMLNVYLTIPTFSWSYKHDLDLTFYFVLCLIALSSLMWKWKIQKGGTETNCLVIKWPICVKPEVQ